MEHLKPQDEKCVMVLDAALPAGILANTAAILGFTLGKKIPHHVGADVFDKAGEPHLGIVDIPVPILRGDAEKLRELREKLRQTDFSDLIVADFSDIAQSSATYDEYIRKAAGADKEEIRYLGLALYGDKKKINKLTGNTGLLR